MADQKKVQFTITEGPSKFDLMSALFVSDFQNSHTVTFTIRGCGPHAPYPAKVPTRTLEINVSMVERENGSGQSWNIVGLRSDNGKRFICYYDSRRRSGVVIILEE